MTQPAHPAQPDIFAVVDDRYLLPLDKAVEVVKSIAAAQRVDTDWGDNPFKPSKSGVPVSLKVLTPSQYAVLQLDRQD